MDSAVQEFNTSGTKTGRTQTARPNRGVTSPVDLAEQAVAEFEGKKKILLTFIAENAKTFEIFDRLADDYNVSREAAKDLVRGVGSDSTINIGPFKRIPASKTIINPQRLPPSMLLVPGVVKSVDRDILLALVDDGKLEHSILDSATDRVAQTPRVSGPREINYCP
jgi:hypothetical protein